MWNWMTVNKTEVTCCTWMLYLGGYVPNPQHALRGIQSGVQSSELGRPRGTAAKLGATLGLFRWFSGKEFTRQSRRCKKSSFSPSLTPLSSSPSSPFSSPSYIFSSSFPSSSPYSSPSFSPPTSFSSSSFSVFFSLVVIFLNFVAV